MDLDATMATMTDDPYVNHVPVATGGVGFEGVVSSTETTSSVSGRTTWRSRPSHARSARTRSSTSSSSPSRTTSRCLSSCPGSRRAGAVRLAFCVVVGFEDGKVAHEHIYWDQASLLVQVGCSIPRSSLSPAPSRPRTCSIRGHTRSTS